MQSLAGTGPQATASRRAADSEQVRWASGRCSTVSGPVARRLLRRFHRGRGGRAGQAEPFPDRLQAGRPLGVDGGTLNLEHAGLDRGGLELGLAEGACVAALDLVADLLET